MKYNKGNNIIYKVLRKLFGVDKEEESIELKTDISGKDQYYKDLELPILRDDTEDDKYYELFDAILHVIRNEYKGTIYCIRCGGKLKRFVKEILADYGSEYNDIEIMEMYSNEYETEDERDINYCRTDFLFESDSYISINNIIRKTATRHKFMVSMTLHNESRDFYNPYIINMKYNKEEENDCISNKI